MADEDIYKTHPQYERMDPDELDKSRAQEQAAPTPVNVASKPALKPEEDPGVKSLGNQIKMLHEMANRYVPEDDATRRRRERAENARRITANVGDGLAALANLVGATKGAPVVQSATMASKVEQRLAELRQEREANEQKFMNYSLKENELINQRAATVRQLEAEKAAKDKREADIKKDDWRFQQEVANQPYKTAEQKARTRYWESHANVEDIASNNAEQMEEAKLITEKARANAQNASAEASRASAASHNRANPAEFSAWDKHGREHKFKTKDAADRFATQQGTFQKEPQESKSTVSDGRKTRTTSTTKPGGYPAKPNIEDMTMPGVSSSDENTMPGVKR